LIANWLAENTFELGSNGNSYEKLVYIDTTKKIVVIFINNVAIDFIG
jgi:hypothetical protein